MRKIDIIGNIYNRLEVIEELKERNKTNHIQYICKCICGNTIIATGSSLKSGNSKSCGCYKKEMIGIIHNKHLMCNTKEYRTWSNIKARVLYKGSHRYKGYAGRGIIICDRWKNSFQNFIDDMGFAPTQNHSIDRINNNGNYEPSNCRWATIQEQALNKRSTLKFLVEGEELFLKEFLSKFNITYNKFLNLYYVNKLNTNQIIEKLCHSSEI